MHLQGKTAIVTGAGSGFGEGDLPPDLVRHRHRAQG
ncbi:Uncharacterised protein [Bordetella holmesii]|nr:Uncharacterised protein [Bordetella holmesii]